MKSNQPVNVNLLSLLLTLGVSLCSVPSRADNSTAPEGVAIKDGVPFILQAGARLPMTNEVTLPHDIVVMTNGTFRLRRTVSSPPLLWPEECGGSSAISGFSPIRGVRRSAVWSAATSVKWRR